MSTILITGGAGFLGSHLADRYAQKGDRVIIVDHYKREKLRFLPESAEICQYDFTDPHVRKVIIDEKPDVVFHLAAQISVTKSVMFPKEDAEQNILASLRLLEWCKDAKIGKCVFASSGGAIYGNHPQVPTPLIKNAEPLSPYGIGKQAFEYYLASAELTHGLPWVSVRFSNLYGPRQQVVKPIGEGNVISLFLERMLVTKDPFTIYGDGTATRDYLHVKDAVDILEKAAESSFCGIVNAGTGREVSIIELIEVLQKIHGTSHPHVFEKERKGEVYRSAIDPASAKEALHWEARVPLYEGLMETYAWYKATFGG